MLILPQASNASLKQFFDEYKPLIFRYIVKEIRKGIKNNLPEVKLFKFPSTGVIGACRKNEYIQVLHQAMDLFVEAELYEDAAIVRDTLNQVKVRDDEPKKE